jgi:hypothetical protein
MICWYERTAYYNLATHRRCETVDIFGLKRGLVYKDEQGKIEIQVAVDWPVIAGLSRDKK